MEKWDYTIYDGFTREGKPRGVVNEEMARLIYKHLRDKGTLVCDCNNIKGFMIGDDYHELTKMFNKGGE